MKIRRIQITMEPSCPITVAGNSGYKTFTVEVCTDCRQVFRTVETFHEDNFSDIFGHLMRDAEFRIRKMVTTLNPPKTSP